MSRVPGGLWRHRDFRTLWAGRATSLFGSYVGSFAYDFVAILTLHASPGQIAILNGCALSPRFLVGPWAGVWADRLRRRPLLMASDLGRAAALASIPCAAVGHVLTMSQLYAVAVVCSALTVLFDIAYAAYVPTFVGPERLLEANSVLRATDSAAEAGGWGVAGALVQVFSAPLVVAADAASFVASALSFFRLGRYPEAQMRRSEDRRRWWREARQGLDTMWRDRVLRALALVEVTGELAGNAIGVVIVLFFVRELRVPPALLGPIFGIGGVSGVMGAVVAQRAGRRFGQMRTMVGALVLDKVGLVPVVAAAGPLPMAASLLVLGQCTDAGMAMYRIHSLSLMQQRAPTHVAGRVNAAFVTLQGGAMLLGLVVGGLLGGAIGLRATLAVAMVINLLIPLGLALVRLERGRSAVPSQERVTSGVAMGTVPEQGP
jgi:MFS family permease